MDAGHRSSSGRAYAYTVSGDCALVRTELQWCQTSGASGWVYGPWTTSTSKAYGPSPSIVYNSLHGGKTFDGYYGWNSLWW